jgi:hypothetical protein
MICNSCETELDGDWEIIEEQDSLIRIRCSSAYFFQKESKSGKTTAILSMCLECWNREVGLESKNDEIEDLKHQLDQKTNELNSKLKSVQEKLEKEYKKEREELEKSLIFDLSKFHKVIEMGIGINNPACLQFQEELKKDFIQDVQDKINGKTKEIIEKQKLFCEKEIFDYKKQIENSLKIQNETLVSMNNMNLNQEIIAETANVMCRGRNNLEEKMKCLNDFFEKLNKI